MVAHRSLVCALTLCLLLAAAPARAQQINTTLGGSDAWNPAGIFQDPRGYPPMAHGQLFTVPSTTSFLSSFSFWLAQFDQWGSARYRAHLANWDDATSTFADLWTSGERTVSTDTVGMSPEPLSAYGEQSFAPGLALSPNVTYLAYLDVSSVISYVNKEGLEALAGGALAWREGTIGSVVRIREGGWVDLNEPGADLAFTATFTDSSVVPEPSTVLLLATGLIGMLGMGLVRKRTSV